MIVDNMKSPLLIVDPAGRSSNQYPSGFDGNSLRPVRSSLILIIPHILNLARTDEMHEPSHPLYAETRSHKMMECRKDRAVGTPVSLLSASGWKQSSSVRRRILRVQDCFRKRLVNRGILR